MRQIFQVVLLGIIVLSNQHVLAATSSAEATITNVQFSVMSLDPGNGITPSFSFQNNTGPVAEAYFPSGSMAEVGQQRTTSPTQFSAISTQIGQPGVSYASASIGTDFMTSSAFESVSGSYQNSLAEVSAGANNNTFDQPIFSQLLLVVSPQTQLNVTGNLNASSNLACSASDIAAYNCSSSAFAYFQFSGAYSLATGQAVDFSESNSVFIFAQGTQSQSLSGNVWLNNPNNESIIATFYATASSSAYLGGVSAVPEAGTSLFMALGLCTVLAATKRRYARR